MTWSDGWQTWEALPGVSLDVFHASGAGTGHALITGGIHGDEYEGPAAIAELVATLDPARVKGALTAVPVANPPAFHAGTRRNPDGLNLARCFPGRKDGSATEGLAAQLFDTLLSGVTHLIDLHSGGVEYEFLPVTGFYGEISQVNPSFRAAVSFGLPVLWQLPETVGVLSFEAHRRKVVAIGTEYLGMGRLSRQGAAAYRDGIERCLVAWELYEGDFAPVGRPSILTGDWQLAEADGLIHNQVALNEQVEAGQPLCEIVDLRGHVLQKLRALSKGIVGGLRSKAYIRSGDWAVLVHREHAAPSPAAM